MIIGGLPVYGGTAIKQIEYYDPNTNSFSILQDYLFDSSDPDWLPFLQTNYNRPLYSQQTNDGNYILIAYQLISGNYYFTLFSVDPSLKTILKIIPKNELPNSSTHFLQLLLLIRIKMWFIYHQLKQEQTPYNWIYLLPIWLIVQFIHPTIH